MKKILVVIFTMLFCFAMSPKVQAIYYGNVTSDINGSITLTTYSSDGGACISGIPCEIKREFSREKIHPIVYTTSKTHLYSTTTSERKKIAVLKKGALLKVQKNNSYLWEKVTYNGKSGYVREKVITLKDPIKYTSYIMQPFKYMYHYQIDSKGELFVNDRLQPELLGRPYFIAISWFKRIYFYENHAGMQVNRFNNYIFKYPFKIGNTWTYKDINTNQTITSKVMSVNRTIKTPIKTFKNVVEIYQSNGETWYLAKNVGVIKKIATNENITLIK